MDKLKDRMYNFEVTPPPGVWDSIAAELDHPGAMVVPIGKSRENNKKRFYWIAAAACITAVIFSGVWFFSQKQQPAKQVVSAPVSTKETIAIKENKPENTVKISAPATALKPVGEKKEHESVAQNKPQKKSSSKVEDDNTPGENTALVRDTPPASSYITIAGPEGQPVKVSSKVASLIESSDNSYPPKPVWNKKINKWKDIMKANTLTPTTGNFLDIVELTNSLKEK